MTPQSSPHTIRPTGEVSTGTIRPTGEVPVYCDCCPRRPKKMAVIQPDAIQIISRRSGKKHIVRIPLPPIRHSRTPPVIPAEEHHPVPRYRAGIQKTPLP